MFEKILYPTDFPDVAYKALYFFAIIYYLSIMASFFYVHVFYMATLSHHI